MATLRELALMALEELAKTDKDGLIPKELKFHQSADAVKPLSHKGNYDDHGNFCGSLVMMLLLFPSECGLIEEGIEEGNFKLLDCLNGCGDREGPLRFEGKTYQRSGKGQNNYRTNLLDMPGYFIGSQMGPYGPGPMGPYGPEPTWARAHGPQCDAVISRCTTPPTPPLRILERLCPSNSRDFFGGGWGQGQGPSKGPGPNGPMWALAHFWTHFGLFLA